MPERDPPYQTCDRRFQQWVRNGKLEEALKLLARHPHDVGKLNPEEALANAASTNSLPGSSATRPTTQTRLIERFRTSTESR
jgi:hypothetical protein